MLVFAGIKLHNRRVQSSLLGCLVILLRPAVRFALRRGFKLQDLIAAAKVAFIEEGAEELRRSRVKVSTSRLSIISGVHRQDVAKAIDKREATDAATAPERLLTSYALDVATRVLNHWMVDGRYVRKDGSPRTLSFEDHNSEFYELVRAVSKDLNPASVLFELERTGHVNRTSRGLALVRASFTPDRDPREGFIFVERDMHDIIAAASENLFNRPRISNLHARTDFDNIRPSALPSIRSWFLSEGHRFHRAAREFLSQFDQDISPDQTFTGTGVKVSLGTFALTAPLEDEQERRGGSDETAA